jgi:hypothetical protein
VYEVRLGQAEIVEMTVSYAKYSDIKIEIRGSSGTGVVRHKLGGEDDK